MLYIRTYLHILLIEPTFPPPTRPKYIILGGALEIRSSFIHEAEIQNYKFRCKIKLIRTNGNEIENVYLMETIDTLRFTDIRLIETLGIMKIEESALRELAKDEQKPHIFTITSEVEITLPASQSVLIVQSDNLTFELSSTPPSTLPPFKIIKCENTEGDLSWRYPCGLNTICIQSSSKVQCKCKKGYLGEPSNGKDCSIAKPGQIKTLGGRLLFPVEYETEFDNQNSQKYQTAIYDTAKFVDDIFDNIKGYITGSSRIMFLRFSTIG